MQITASPHRSAIWQKVRQRQLLAVVHDFRENYIFFLLLIIFLILLVVRQEFTPKYFFIALLHCYYPRPYRPDFYIYYALPLGFHFNYNQN